MAGFVIKKVIVEYLNRIVVLIDGINYFCDNNEGSIMANAIKSVPTLKGKDAVTFVKMAKSSEKKRETVDFTQQSIIARKILAKAGLK